MPTYTVKVPCPICGMPLEVEATVTQDQDGADPPYGPPSGTRTFYALEDYTINWPTHDNDCRQEYEAIALLQSERFSTLSLDQQSDQQRFSNFEQSIADKAAEAYANDTDGYTGD